MIVNSRFLLYPVSLAYAFILKVRNYLYDKNILASSEFSFPIICVGNLAVGGTGKSPMTEYLIELLKDNYTVATLSRGYKRKTRGFAIAHPGSTAHEIGDEPMQFQRKYPNITIAVGEERLVAIPQLLHERPETDVIILDDAFQHRQVKAGLNILLTQYAHLYTDDFVLPAGNLRDIVKSANRAQIIIVTKCPVDLSNAKRDEIITKIKPLSHQQIYFTTIVYSTPLHLFQPTTIQLNSDTGILLICGIANPEPLKKHVNRHFNTVEILQYKDHHIFNSDDLKEIKRRFNGINNTHKIILTTEKDGVRLEKFKSELFEFPIYALPMKHSFLFDAADKFNHQIIDFVKNPPQVHS